MYNFCSNINQRNKKKNCELQAIKYESIFWFCFDFAHWTNIFDIFTWIEFLLSKWFLYIVHFECHIHEHLNQNLQQWISQRHRFTMNGENRKEITTTTKILRIQAHEKLCSFMISKQIGRQGTKTMLCVQYT